MVTARVLSSQAGHLRRAQAIRATAFEYELPTANIALCPVKDRSSSRLLVARTNCPHPGKLQLNHHHFHELSQFLPYDSMLAINNSRVIPARIPMRKTTGAKAEILLLAPSNESDPTPMLDMSLASSVPWKCFVGGRRIRAGDVLQSDSDSVSFSAEIISRDGTAAVVRFQSDTPGLSLASALTSLGQTPLPPYIKREANADDRMAYQTVYAERAGSVAAPTAGLHVTDHVLDDIRSRGIEILPLTLHVGAGTFAQLGGPTAGDHHMHAERFSVDISSLRALACAARDFRPRTALGTTSVRTLESVYWHGVRLLHEGATTSGTDTHGNCQIDQWEAYEYLDSLGLSGLPSLEEALTAVIANVEARKGQALTGITRLLIVPGYPFQVVSNLVTNFHQPASTLLMLVAAFCGGRDTLFDVYGAALRENYRFLSYGDSSVFIGPS